MNWSIAAILLPIPFLGLMFAIAASIYGGLALSRASRPYSKVCLGLALFSLLENLTITGLVLKAILK